MHHHVLEGSFATACHGSEMLGLILMTCPTRQRKNSLPGAGRTSALSAGSRFLQRTFILELLLPPRYTCIHNGVVVKRTETHRDLGLVA
jgi:hypothetical protein